MKTIILRPNLVALVDDEDFERYGQLAWVAFWNAGNRRFYARRTVGIADGKRKHIFLHREIMGNPAGMVVDHKNHDTLDCRRENLRVCTRLENNRNCSGPRRNSSSGIRGVFWNKRDKRWSAYIRVNKKQVYLGYFKRVEDAKVAYAAANIKYFGEYGGKF